MCRRVSRQSDCHARSAVSDEVSRLMSPRISSKRDSAVSRSTPDHVSEAMVFRSRRNCFAASGRQSTGLIRRWRPSSKTDRRRESFTGRMRSRISFGARRISFASWPTLRRDWLSSRSKKRCSNSGRRSATSRACTSRKPRTSLAVGVRSAAAAGQRCWKSRATSAIARSAAASPFWASCNSWARPRATSIAASPIDSTVTTRFRRVRAKRSSSARRWVSGRTSPSSPRSASTRA